MIRDEIMEWVLCALMGCAAVMVAVLVVGTGAPAAPMYDVRCTMYDVKREAPAARGSEERAEREFLRWHEEWADAREAQERYLEERRGR